MGTDRWLKNRRCLWRTVRKSTVKQFSDGEISINLEETVRGYDVYLVQSTNEPVNDYYLELLIMIDALKRASAKRSMLYCRIMAMLDKIVQLNLTSRSQQN